MADFNSDQKAALGAFPKEFIRIVDTLARVRTSYAKFTGGVETLAQNDRIYLFDLPGGARVISYETKNEAFGSSVVLDVGTTADPDFIADGVDIAAAGSDRGQAMSFAILPGQAGDAVPIYATLLGANPADDADLEVLVTWALD